MLVDTHFTCAPLLKEMAAYLPLATERRMFYAQGWDYQRHLDSLLGEPFSRLLAQIAHVPHLEMTRPQNAWESHTPTTLTLRDGMSSLFLGMAERCAGPDEDSAAIVNACGAAALLATKGHWRKDSAVEICVWTLNDLAGRQRNPALARNLADTLAAHTPPGHALARPLARIGTAP